MTYDVRLRFRSPWRSAAQAAGRAARAALAHEAVGPGGLTVVLVDEAEMRRLHRDFAGEDSATDVLSFPDDSADAAIGTRYYGDVIVCVPVAERQAESAGHSLVAEIRLLAVHGTLHLLGFDHEDETTRRHMWALQDAILASPTLAPS
jgi:probable rRNA maturation factor